MLFKVNKRNWIKMKNKYGFKQESAIRNSTRTNFRLGKSRWGRRSQKYARFYHNWEWFVDSKSSVILEFDLDEWNKNEFCRRSWIKPCYYYDSSFGRYQAQIQQGNHSSWLPTFFAVSGLSLSNIVVLTDTCACAFSAARALVKTSVVCPR